jgi:hypothetical protein
VELAGKAQRAEIRIETYVKPWLTRLGGEGRLLYTRAMKFCTLQSPDPVAKVPPSPESVLQRLDQAL